MRVKTRRVFELQIARFGKISSSYFKHYFKSSTDLGWEYTMWNFQDFSANQILREINFGHFEAPKTAILTIWVAMNFKFLGTYDIFKCEIFLKNQNSTP